MNDELKERVHALLHAHHVDIAFNERGYGAIAGAIAALLAEVRAETEARVVEAAVQVVTTCWKCGGLVHAAALPHCLDECAPQRFEEGDEAPYSDEESAIRALASADYVAVRRDGFAVIAEAAEELEARIRMERAGYESSRADEIRTALSRAGKGE